MGWHHIHAMKQGSAQAVWTTWPDADLTEYVAIHLNF